MLGGGPRRWRRAPGPPERRRRRLEGYASRKDHDRKAGVVYVRETARLRDYTGSTSVGHARGTGASYEIWASSRPSVMVF